MISRRYRLLMAACVTFNITTGLSAAELTTADFQLLASCRFAITRPDLTSPYQQEILKSALARREIAWRDAKLDPTLLKTTEIIRAACNQVIPLPTAQPDIAGGVKLSPISSVPPAFQPTVNTRPSGFSAVKTPPASPPPVPQTGAQPGELIIVRQFDRARKEVGTLGSQSGLAPVLPSPVRSADQLEPWPPPTATEYAARLNIAAEHPTWKTVGDALDALQNELSSGGHHKLRYWGAPDGFAIVIPQHAIDDRGRPISNSEETNASVIGSGIVQEIWKSVPDLVSGPVRRSRILLFVITTDTSVGDSQALMTPEIGKHWDRNGRFAPSQIDRTRPFTSNHFAAFFVYVFEKGNDGIHLLTTDRNHQPALQHLHSANLKWVFN